MRSAEIKAVLKDGGAVFGMMITAGRNIKWGNAIAGGGADYVIIDTEHSQRSREELSDLTIILKAEGVSPIIRIPYPVPHYVAMALDAGAEGVLVPYCEDPEVIRHCASVKMWHPMKGEYLERIATTGEHVSQKTREYLANRHKDHILIIGIESEPGYRNLDEILTIEGIDAIFVGPNDMSTSLGIPDEYDNPRYWEVVGDIVRKAEATGRPTMIHQQNIPDSTRAIQAGARFVLHSSDARMMQRQMQTDFTALREAAEARLGRELGVALEDTIETV